MRAYELGLNLKNGLIVCTELRQEVSCPQDQEEQAFITATDFLKQIMLEFNLDV